MVWNVTHITYYIIKYQVHHLHWQPRVAMIIQNSSSLVALGFVTMTISSASINNMMTSSNGNIFRITGHLCGEFTGHKDQWRGALMFSLICTRINGWVNNREAGDLRRYHAHYDVIVMKKFASRLGFQSYLFYMPSWLHLEEGFRVTAHTITISGQ